MLHTLKSNFIAAQVVDIDNNKSEKNISLAKTFPTIQLTDFLKSTSASVKLLSIYYHSLLQILGHPLTCHLP